ncbi:MAG: glycoside hydrolase family 78 protein [Bacteroidales bacterium]|nr:glycoside hydrolase family 78 protein [Bacteroidales bacterium]
MWNKNGVESDWSETGTFRTGLFSEKDWAGAEWIGYEEILPELKLVPGVHGNGNNQGKKALQRPVVPLFRKPFNIQKEISEATLFISGLGHYEAYINGGKVGNSFLAPGWTDYDKTVLYNCYDVTKILNKGNNVIGAIVGNGFYNINRERYRKLVIAYGMPKMICNLQIEYTDGTIENVITDNSWKTSPSPITYSSIYGGEDYDARLEQNNWNKAEFDDSLWNNVKLVSSPEGILVPETDYPLQVMESFKAQDIFKLKPDVHLFDFGQNASGIVELKIKGKKGKEVRLIPAELITKDKEANQKASGAPYYLSYTLKGDGVEVWKPRFTYYGFRYVQVEGAVPQNANASSDLPQIIGLEQSYLMGNSIHFNYNIYHFYSKIINDMMQAQTENGLVPDIAPEFVEFEGGFRDSPEWGSASVILPWMIYKWYGDKTVLEKAWPMMLRYVNYLKSKSENNIVSHGLGDWFDLGPKQPGVSQLTPKSLTATAIYFYDLKLLSEIAQILGKVDNQEKLITWADEVKTSFNTKFFDKEFGVIATGSQTAMAMPWSVGLVDEEFKEIVINNLEDSIRANGKALTAGDVGFHYLVDALTKGGKSQLLYEMNNRNDVPGYGFQLAKGATALTESWPALENVSNNHLMLGHLMEWFYAGLGGIGQTESSTAYKEIVIKPQFIDGLSHASASYESPYGQINCKWEKTGNAMNLNIDIPVNTTALVYFNMDSNSTISEGKSKNLIDNGIEIVSENNGKVICRVDSGHYSFKIE